MFGMEAARLYATVGLQGMDTLTTGLKSAGTLVDQFGGKKAEAVLGVNTSGAKAAIEDIASRYEAVGGSRRTIMMLANPNPAIHAIGQVSARWDELKAKVSTLALGGRLGGAAQMLAGGAGLRGTFGAGVGQVMEGMSTGGFGGGIAAGAKFLGPVGIAAGAAAAVGGFALGKAGEMEKYQTQLSVLLGSMDAAQKRMAELTQFAATTPFELPEVVNASKTLQVFAGDVLSTGNNLRLIGDVAAGTGQNFGEVSMWFGRMYDAMKSGRPFGEATMRLQEMGAIGGQDREMIEKLALSVKNGTMTMEEAWPRVAGSFGRFSGMMEKQSTTLEGKMSNLSDAFGQTGAKLGSLLLPVAKVLVDVLITIVTAVGGAIELFGKFVGVIADVAGGIVDFLSKLPGVKEFFDFLSGAIDFVGDLWDGAVDLFNDGAKAIGDGFDYVTGKTEEWERKTRSATEMVAQQWHTDFRAGEREVIDITQSMGAGVVDVFKDVKRSTIHITDEMMSGIVDEVKSGRSEWQQAWDNLRSDAEDSMSVTVEIARIKAKLAKIAASKGWESGDPEWIAALVDTRTKLENRLDELTPVAGRKVERMIDRMGKILKNDKTIDREAEHRAQKLAEKFEALPGHAYDWGAKLLRQYIKGIHSQQGALQHELYLASGKVANLLKLMSPAKEGPLSEGGGPEGWGERGAMLYAKGWSTLRMNMPAVSDWTSELPGGVRAPTKAEPIPYRHANSLGRALGGIHIGQINVYGVRDAEDTRRAVRRGLQDGMADVLKTQNARIGAGARG